MKEQKTKEQVEQQSGITHSQVMDKIKQAIEADKDLSAGGFFDFKETTHAGNSCARTFRATIGVSVVIYNES